jgi:transcriptional regulator with XRE-family HTH domain
VQPALRSRVAEFREQAGLTQAQLAVLIGVTTNTIQNWESGKSGVEQIMKFLKLCTVLSCELQDLIEEMPSSKIEESKPGSFSIEDLQKLRQQWGTDKPASATKPAPEKKSSATPART